MIRTLARRLSQAGVLGLNRRNADYTLRYNQRRHFPLVDNKLRTKTLAIQAGIAVPALYGVIESDYQLRHLDRLLSPYNQFALKPAWGPEAKASSWCRGETAKISARSAAS